MIHSREKDFSIQSDLPVHSTNLNTPKQQELDSYYLYMQIAKYQQLIIRKRESKKYMYNPDAYERLYLLEEKVKEWIRLLAEQTPTEEATS